jgi:hypothetical protein
MSDLAIGDHVACVELESPFWGRCGTLVKPDEMDKEISDEIGKPIIAVCAFDKTEGDEVGITDKGSDWGYGITNLSAFAPADTFNGVAAGHARHS